MWGAFLIAIFLSIPVCATMDQALKEREQFGKSIRTKMPPQLMIDAIQKELKLRSPGWKTSWQTFEVEDDDHKDEYVIIARAVEKPWLFSMVKDDCPKPANYELISDTKSLMGQRMDVLIGVKRKRSWFRYIVNVYHPMYPYWKNPCYMWSLPPGKANDPFYRENYTMKIYSDNLAKQVYALMEEMSSWKPPKDVKKIPVMKGKGVELIGGESELLTDEEKALPISEQQKILEKKRKEEKKKKK